ncbi:hypothetical protein [Brachybacterium fresconis]|uniref:Uncharacterized protein n=1 Tax=Brachybacterium fresconis TaxID=173363 RepID=A0ABS4YHA1_9MICO|nr:hypothetical protein [Brachybacterium fresconis]
MVGSATGDDQQDERDERDARADHPGVAEEASDAGEHSPGYEQWQCAAEGHEQHGSCPEEQASATWPVIVF